MKEIRSSIDRLVVKDRRRCAVVAEYVLVRVRLPFVCSSDWNFTRRWNGNEVLLSDSGSGSLEKNENLIDWS